MRHSNKPEQACLIVSRNLGDAVIQAGFLKQLVQRGFAQRYVVWTRPQVAFLFEAIPDCSVVTSQFPVGTTKQFGGAEVFRFLKAAGQVRRLRVDVSIDLIGDFRERVFARLVRAHRHLHIGWQKGHPFNRLIRNPFGVGNPAIEVPTGTPNVYAGYQLMLETLCPVSDKAFSRDTRSPSQMQRIQRIGIHPFASQPCKLWPKENWHALVGELLDRGLTVFAFAAPSERSALERILGVHASSVNIVAGSIPEFAKSVAGLDVMIGLDSFSVHMAQLQGVRSVLINAGNSPTLWAPPDALMLADSGGCPYYPCFNVPKCEDTDRPYGCINAIDVKRVTTSEILKSK